MFVYGFEDLTGAQWALLEALAGRCEVLVSLPYEPGRPAFAALERTANDLAALARGRGRGAAGSELVRRGAACAPGAGALRGRRPRARRRSRAPSASSRRPARGPRSSWSARRSSAAPAGRSARRTTSGSSSLPSSGCAPRSRRPSARSAIPYAVEGPRRLARTPFGRALLALLRFAWRGGERADLYAFLRSPYSGLARQRVDFAEGRLAWARGVRTRAGRRADGAAARPARSRRSIALRADGSPLEALDDLCRAMLQAAWGLERPPVSGQAELDLQAEEAVRGVLRDLAALEALGRPAGREEILVVARAGDRPIRGRGIRGASSSSTSSAPGRGASASSSSSAWRRAGCRDAPSSRRSSRRKRAAVSRSEPAGISCAEITWRATGISSTAPARERGGGSTWFARPPPRRGGRSRRAPSTTRCARGSRRPRSSAGHGGGRCLRSHWELHAAPTERERLRAVAALASDHETVARASPLRRAGAARSTGRWPPLPGRPGWRTRACSSACASRVASR